MLKILGNELVKAIKSKRLIIFISIMVFLSAFFGMVITQIGKNGTVTSEMFETMTGGYFCLQVLGLSADMILPIFATLFVCFLIIDEYNSGTLKLPILCGYSRKNIIYAKALAVIIMMLTIMIVTWLSANVVSVLVWGAEDVIAMADYTLLVYLKTFLAMVAWSIVMIAISLFIQNSGIMIGIMTVILVVSSIAGGMFPQIAKYILVYYLKAFASLGDTVDSALGGVICLLNIIIFGGVAMLRFEKMEIQK